MSTTTRIVCNDKALGEGEKARAAYEKDLAIAERLATSEPERADYQVELAITLSKIGAFSGSTAHLNRAFQILATLQMHGLLALEHESLIQSVKESLHRLNVPAPQREPGIGLLGSARKFLGRFGL